MYELYEEFMAGLDEMLSQIPMAPVTRHLIVNLVLDLPLTPAQTVDFGVESADHYRALKVALDSAMAALEMSEAASVFDRARGDGKALTALVHQYAPDYQHLRFKPS